MRKSEAIGSLLKRLEGLNVQENAPMSAYTSMRVGGPALALAEPRNTQELTLALSAAEECGLETLVMGNGTNLIVSDKGFEGLVIRVKESFDPIKKTAAGMEAGAGALLSDLSKAAAHAGLSGLAWACGIPGTVGGAVAMNAGAYGGDVKSCICRVDYVENGVFHSVTPGEGDFSYRKSAFTPPNRVVVAAEFRLESGSAEEELKLINEYTQKRAEKQPLDYPSAGSVFKRPEGYFTGQLIEQAGLKGAFVGGAQVSEKHAGFIINSGNATCEDVLGLIRLVQGRVFETSGVRLETEVKII